MNSRIKTALFSIAIFSLCLGMTGCKLFDMLTDHEKEIELRIDRMKVAITHKKWPEVAKVTSKDFAFYRVDKRKFSLARVRGRVVNTGHIMFRDRILELPDAWVDFRMKPTKITKVTDTRMLAEVEMRLRIRIHSVDIDNIVWHTRQIWVKETTRGKAGGEKFEWKLKEYHELTAKVGSRGKVFSPGPPLPERRKYYTEETEVIGGVSGQVTGGTPLSTGGKMKKKARSLTQNRDAAIDRND
jgi:hypothetical protein